MNHLKLIDNYQRHINYLRISITDRCNLLCAYCVPRGRIPKLKHREILRYEEILRLVNIGAKMGITKVRVTGGDPLVRKGVYRFLENLCAIEELNDVSLTTNGVLLLDNIERIKTAGIKRLNISMDTLDGEKYHRLTGRDTFDTVWKGIKRAEEMGFHPIKLNVVALRGINDDELVDLAALSIDHPYHVRFIEYMPIGDRTLDTIKPLLATEIKDRLSSIGELRPVKKGANDGPAQRFKFHNAKGEVGFISALSHHFCNKCNRLRLTANGQLRPCLLSDRQQDIKELMRSNCSDQDLVNAFIKAVKYKQSKHCLAGHGANKIHSQMSSIGG